VRLEGLKLLGSVLGALAECKEVTPNLEEKFALLQQRLEVIRNIDQSPECRLLAEKYSTLLLQPSV
jgi:hypothetical protein